MGRRRTGTAWEKPKGSGQWLAAITLHDGTRATKPITRKSSAPVDATYAREAARAWQRAYDEGEWTPPAKGADGRLAAPSPVHTVGSWATAWARGLTIGTAADVRYAIARYVERDPIASLPRRTLAPCAAPTTPSPPLRPSPPSAAPARPRAGCAAARLARGPCATPARRRCGCCGARGMWSWTRCDHAKTPAP